MKKKQNDAHYRLPVDRHPERDPPEIVAQNRHDKTGREIARSPRETHRQKAPVRICHPAEAKTSR